MWFAACELLPFLDGWPPFPVFIVIFHGLDLAVALQALLGSVTRDLGSDGDGHAVLKKP